MKIFVGSTNPVKIKAVLKAAVETWPDVEVIGIEVNSGVSEQPMTDDETRLGATNRAKSVLQAGLKTIESEKTNVLGVGLEGGVFEKNPGELWSTVWAVIVDHQGNINECNGARFKVPAIVAEKILAGQEMGPVIGEIFKDDQVKKKQGMIGVITNNFIDRTQVYSAIVKTALGLWYGRNWDKNLK